jgi:hypothetical protein
VVKRWGPVEWAAIGTIVAAIIAVLTYLGLQPRRAETPTASVTTFSSTPSTVVPSTMPTTTAQTSGNSVSDAAFTRRLRLPLISGSYVSIDLAPGRVSAPGVGADEVYYQSNDSGQHELRFSSLFSHAAILEGHSSGPVQQEECRQAIDSSPLAEPIRRLAKGTMTCATSREGGIALLRVVEPPDSKGTLTLEETYWTPSG